MIFFHKEKPNEVLKTGNKDPVFVKTSYYILTLGKFQSRVECGESTGPKYGFLPPVLRKDTFYLSKGILLACQWPPFDGKSLPPEGQNWEK